MAAQPGGRWVRQLRPGHRQFSLTEEQAFCLADPNGPNVSAAFVAGLGYLRAEPQLTEAFRTGAGVGWHEHDEDVFVGCDAFYRPGYVAELIPNWIPALEGVEAEAGRGRPRRRHRLRAGLDVGADGAGVPA